MTSQTICMIKTVNIWRTRQVIEELKTPELSEPFILCVKRDD